MSNSPSKDKTINKLKPELLLAVLAVLISFSTLFVYLYQSSLMRTQQKMSVWPHITFAPSWSSDYLSLNLTNKGIGPAIIKNVKIEVNENQVDGVQEIMKYVPDSLKSEFTYSSLWRGQVIMAGESIQFFENNDPGTIKYLLELFENGKTKIEICYCSVYDDCWVSSGINVTESNCN